MSEKIKILWIIALSLLTGLLVEYPLQTLTLGLIVYVVWVSRQIDKINNWISLGAQIDKYPNTNGDFNKIVNSVIKINAKHTAEKQLHQKSIIKLMKFYAHFLILQ